MWDQSTKFPMSVSRSSNRRTQVRFTISKPIHSNLLLGIDQFASSQTSNRVEWTQSADFCIALRFRNKPFNPNNWPIIRQFWQLNSFVALLQLFQRLHTVAARSIWNEMCVCYFIEISLTFSYRWICQIANWWLNRWILIWMERPTLRRRHQTTSRDKKKTKEKINFSTRKLEEKQMNRLTYFLCFLWVWGIQRGCVFSLFRSTGSDSPSLQSGQFLLENSKPTIENPKKVENNKKNRGRFQLTIPITRLGWIKRAS